MKTLCMVNRALIFGLIRTNKHIVIFSACKIHYIVFTSSPSSVAIFYLIVLTAVDNPF